MKNASLTSKSSSLANGWPMLWHRERCPTNWYQGRRSYVWYLKGYKWCHSNNQVMSIKIQDSSLNHLPQMQIFASIRSTPFMEIGDKGGEIVQRYESFGRDWGKQVEVGHGHGHGQIGSNIEELRKIKILGQEMHTSRGEQDHELWLVAFDTCIVMCLLALHNFF